MIFKIEFVCKKGSKKYFGLSALNSKVRNNRETKRQHQNQKFVVKQKNEAHLTLDFVLYIEVK